MKEGSILLVRVSLKGLHSSSPHQQSLSQLRRLRRASRPRRQRRQSRHHNPSFAALVEPMLQYHRGQLLSAEVHAHRPDHRVHLQ